MIKKQNEQDRSHGRTTSKQTNLKVLQFVIQDHIVVEIAGYGYPTEFTMKSLNLRQHNYATTAYFLLEKQS